MTLERAPTGHAAAHSLRAVFLTFDIHQAPNSPMRKQAHAEILFSNVGRLSVTEWQHQNPIQGLSITRRRDEELNADLFLVRWGGLGHEVSFDCDRITVVDLVDLNPFQKSFPQLLP